MSFAINATDIALVSKNHSAKLPSFAKRVSRRQFNKLLTQKTRTQKKRWADRSRSNARDMKRAGWEFTEQDRKREESEEDRLMWEEIAACYADKNSDAYCSCCHDYWDESMTPVTLTPSASLQKKNQRVEEHLKALDPFWDFSVQISLETLDLIDNQLYRLSQNQGFALFGQELQVLGWFMAAFPCPENISVTEWLTKLRSEIQFHMNQFIFPDDFQ
jgi:hypothetical protein